MSLVKRFEELQCWKESRVLVHKIYRITGYGKLANDFFTKNQLRRAALTTMNNIAEGFARFSKKELIRFLDISQSFRAEVKSMLYLLEDLEYTKKNKVLELHE